jgi:hypothetical protein
VADVSTYNCNAFYELGVRHALRPYTTIIISEDGLTFPFDLGHIAIRKYHHMGDGIVYEEVERMRKELSEAIKIVSEKEADDSPVYTFIKNLQPPTLPVAATVDIQATTTIDAAAESTKSPTVSVLMLQAEEALQKAHFTVAKALYTHLHEKMPNDVYLVQKLILATYKLSFRARRKHWKRR